MTTGSMRGLKRWGHCVANQWLRLWHDMPTDPKWRTIAKASGQRIGDVMAVYVHLLVCASNATERGRTQSFNAEDVASALDLETDQVSAIVEAMQRRVLDGDKVAGWDKRQVSREDGAAERSKAWREAEKAKKQTQLSATERNRTQTERNQTPDKEEIREEEKKDKHPTDAPARPMAEPPLLALVGDAIPKPPTCPHLEILALWAEVLPGMPQHDPERWRGPKALHLGIRWKETAVAKRWDDKSQGLAYFRKLFGYVARSEFLVGRAPTMNGKRPFVIELEWLVILSNWDKVHEGKYHEEATA